MQVLDEAHVVRTETAYKRTSEEMGAQRASILQGGRE
jgi:hypothetical protein